MITRQGFKICSLCKNEKSWNDFSIRPNRLNRTYNIGLRSKCKPCVVSLRNTYSKNVKKWYENAKLKNPEFYREKNLKKNYNLTIYKFEEILMLQNGVCAICEGPPMGKGRYHVDHNHKNGKIRGLLCHKCNVALGMVQDSKDLLMKLRDYLIKSELT